MKPALLVIDIQKAFYEEDEVGAKLLTSAVQYVNATIALFRKKGYPVICIQHMEEEWGLKPGNEGFDLPDDLNIEESDIHIHKKYSNSFNKTELLAKLKELEVDTPFITGYSALHCVLATYRGAQDNDLEPIMVRGAIAASDPGQVKMVEDICQLVSFGALKKFFSA